jgi:hypothetical protein
VRPRPTPKTAAKKKRQTPARGKGVGGTCHRSGRPKKNYSRLLLDVCPSREGPSSWMHVWVVREFDAGALPASVARFAFQRNGVVAREWSKNVWSTHWKDRYLGGWFSHCKLRCFCNGVKKFIRRTRNSLALLSRSPKHPGVELVLSCAHGDQAALLTGWEITTLRTSTSK